MSISETEIQVQVHWQQFLRIATNFLTYTLACLLRCSYWKILKLFCRLEHEKGQAEWQEAGRTRNSPSSSHISLDNSALNTVKCGGHKSCIDLACSEPRERPCRHPPEQSLCALRASFVQYPVSWPAESGDAPSGWNHTRRLGKGGASGESPPKDVKPGQWVGLGLGYMGRV